MKENQMLPDYDLCIGDDKSDADIFKVITDAMTSSSLSPVPKVFLSMIRQKPSKDKYYLEYTTEIV